MKALQGTPNDEALFGGNANWRKFVTEAIELAHGDAWGVDTRMVQNLLREYLAFEMKGPVR